MCEREKGSAAQLSLLTKLNSLLLLLHFVYSVCATIQGDNGGERRFGALFRKETTRRLSFSILRLAFLLFALNRVLCSSIIIDSLIHNYQ
jgi:hypothetical protein